jgi:hypothetical protein
MAVALEEILEVHASLPASRAQAGKVSAPLSSGRLKRASGPLVSTTGPPKQSNLRLPFSQTLAQPAGPWGPAGPPIASRSASEPRERRHRSGQKQRPAPGGAQDRSSVGEPWFSGPAGAVALVGRNRGRSQSLAAARLTLSAPSGSAPVFGSLSLKNWPYLPTCLPAYLPTCRALGPCGPADS